MKRILAGSLALLTGLALAQSKDFWQTKDYRQWTEKECRKLLDNSPWAQDHTISSAYIEPLQTQSSDRARERNTQMSYRVQFRSALPVRQALVRWQQLNSKYDQMPPEQKQEFDQRADRLLTASFADLVAIHVSYSSNVAIYDREMANYWQVQTTEKLHNSTFLIGPKGQKIPPQRVTTATGAGREFTLYFPRLVEGQPLVTPQDKTIKLEFNHPRISDQSESRVLLEFKIEKMLMQGAVVY